MNREILFRGKRIDNGEWVYGSFSNKIVGTFDQVVFEEKNQACIITGFSSGGIAHHYVNPDTIGQYTGLKDDRGVKIFEGDIVNWCAGEQHMGYWQWSGVFSVEDIRFLEEIANADSLEIVGNI